MHRSLHSLASALLDVMGVVNDPRQDWRMMAEADLDLDPAFLSLLVRLGPWGPAGVVELSERLGRDHSTVSRQLARLEAAGLVSRSPSPADARVRIARLTPRGEEAVSALAAARLRLLDRALTGWTADELEVFSRSFARFAGALSAMVEEVRSPTPATSASSDE